MNPVLKYRCGKEPHAGMVLVSSEPCPDKARKWVHYNCKYCVSYVSFIVPVDMPLEHKIESFLREWYRLRNENKKLL